MVSSCLLIYINFFVSLAWAKYFDDQGIKYIFFSAALAKRIQEDERESEQIDKQRLNENGNQQVEEEKNEVEMDVQDIEEDEEEDELDQDNSTHNPETPVQQRPLQNSVSAASPAAANEEAPVDDAEAKKIHIYSVDELLDLFTEECPTPLREQGKKRKLKNFY